MNHCEYHLHSELSLLDSCTNYKLYVDKAKELGMTAIAFTEHGNIYNWLEKKKYCEANGIKYIHGCEVYLTEQLEPKVRDNYHTVLLAKNLEGFKELNKLLKTSTDKQHMYYKNRITFDEFLAISDNIISTSACLASPLCRLPQDNPYYEKLVRKYTYLEIQPHVYLPQKDYNEKLIKLAEKYNKKLISGHDTHSLDKYKAECRSILKCAKNIHYDDEDKFDLTFKTTDKILEMYNEQGLNPSVYTKAIENTINMAESIESFTIDNSKKYPDLYDNEEELFKQEVQQALKDKLSQGVLTKDKLNIYIERINEEFEGYKETGMFSFILFMSELIRWCHKNNIPTGFSRGSCGGSLICYLLDIIDLDAIEWQTIFSRFVNKHRKALGDIDIDFSPDDRCKVYEYIINRFGNDKTCYILTTNTVADKGTIDEIGRALKYPLSKVEKIKKEYETNPEKTKEEYKELFYYFDGLVRTVISQGVHPAGIVASPVTLSDNIGTFCYTDKKTKENKLVSMINMDEIHNLNFVKYDILGLKNVAIIRDTCKYINQKYPLSYNINWNDEKVWNDMITSPVGIFQFEGEH